MNGLSLWCIWVYMWLASCLEALSLTLCRCTDGWGRYGYGHVDPFLPATALLTLASASVVLWPFFLELFVIWRSFKRVLTGLHDSCCSQIDCFLSLYSLALTRVSFRDFSFAIWNEGRLLEDISQIWLVLYKVPFPHEYVLEVRQLRVVLRYKG